MIEFNNLVNLIFIFRRKWVKRGKLGKQFFSPFFTQFHLKIKLTKKLNYYIIPLNSKFLELLACILQFLAIFQEITGQQAFSRIFWNFSDLFNRVECSSSRSNQQRNTLPALKILGYDFNSKNAPLKRLPSFSTLRLVQTLFKLFLLDFC